MAGSSVSDRARSKVMQGLTLLILVVFVAAPVQAQSGSPDLVGRLEANDAVFWSEPDAVNGSEPLVWRIEVLEPGLLLRVALDHSDMGGWSLKTDGPGGVSRVSGGPYSAEVFIPEADRGVYTITAQPSSAQDAFIRMRAKLGAPTVPPGKKALLPNLRISPPYDITLTGAPWYLYLAPGYGPSCFPEETAQSQVLRCLRFSFGPENAGAGPLELIYAAPANEGGQNVMYQQITYGDGHTVKRKAGTYEYHAAHAHYHHPLIAGQQLFKVANRRTGAMTEAGVAKKTGFCMGDYALVDWKRFYQDPINSVTSSCGLADAPYQDLIMGLSTGWADIYPYDLEGNYIDFDDAEDGYYVIRAFTDQSGEIQETDESDNTSYAYFKVTGDEVQLLERGYGEDPWDPSKSVLDDPRNLSIPE